jgi:hypothetical protein
MSGIQVTARENQPRFEEIGGGLVIASSLRKMLTLACAAAVLPACLITERKDYQEAPSFPPSIVTPGTATLPLDRIIVLDEVGADGGARELSFEVIVRDPNINDPLRARVFVNRPAAVTDDRALAFLKKEGIVSSNDSSERTFAFVLDMSSLDALRCNKIELMVASDFVSGMEPVEADESARVVWWAGPRGADMTECP